MLIPEQEPETLRAYQDLVPHQKTEKEFWQLYVHTCLCLCLCVCVHLYVCIPPPTHTL